MEKANSQINTWIKEQKIEFHIGLIVFDELHMLQDPDRGYLLESMITKLLYTTNRNVSKLGEGERFNPSSNGVRIVGMSATIPNLDQIQTWLKAELYISTDRPVPLVEYYKIGNDIFELKSREKKRTLQPIQVSNSNNNNNRNSVAKDPDGLGRLVLEVLEEKHSVLVFCATKRACEATVTELVELFKSLIQTDQEKGKILIKYATERGNILAELRKSPVGLDYILEVGIEYGMAYHHAGLTVEERDIIEVGYRKGYLNVLMATSTLAAGVNLPARRVVFKTPMVGREQIDKVRYKQMAGRAGRKGIDDSGESFLIIPPHVDSKKILNELTGPMKPVESCLKEVKNGMVSKIYVFFPSFLKVRQL